MQQVDYVVLMERTLKAHFVRTTAESDFRPSEGFSPSNYWQPLRLQKHDGRALDAFILRMAMLQSWPAAMPEHIRLGCLCCAHCVTGQKTVDKAIAGAS